MSTPIFLPFSFTFIVFVCPPIRFSFSINVTLCFSSAQALLAGKLGATYISPFIGRLDDIGTSGLNLIKEIVSIYNNYNKEIKTQVLAASIRSPLQVTQVAQMGAHVATIPPKIITGVIKGKKLLEMPYLFGPRLFFRSLLGNYISWP